MRLWLIISVLMYIITFAGTYWYWERLNQKKEQYLFLAALLFKLLCGLGLGALYYLYYDAGDTIKYYDRALYLFEWLLKEDNLFASLYRVLFYDKIPDALTILLSRPRAFLMVKLVALAMFFLGPWYLSISLYCSLFSFAGCWFLYRRIKNYAPGWTMPACFSLLFLPSFVFWSSGLLKDSLATAALMVIAGILLLKPEKDNYRKMMLMVLLSVISFVLLFQLKYYTAALFALSVCSWKVLALIQKRMPSIPAYMLLLIAIFSMSLVVGILGTYHPNLHFSRVWHLLWHNYEIIAQLSTPGYYLVFEAPDSVPGGVSTVAKATWSGLFAPLPWQAHEGLSLLLSVEHSLLLLCSILALLGLFSTQMKPSLIVWHLLLYVLLSACLLAIASPNYGSLVRYGVAYRPFAWMMVLSVLMQMTPLRRFVEKFEV